jgi:hypothetical protein
LAVTFVLVVLFVFLRRTDGDGYGNLMKYAVEVDMGGEFNFHW